MPQLSTPLGTTSFLDLQGLIPFSSMEIHLPYLTIILPFFLYFIVKALRTWKKPKGDGLASKLPPGPPKLPIIGNLHLFMGTELPHRCLARLAQKYGPVMQMQFGGVPTMVISSPEGAKEVMKTYDSIFYERPYLYAVELLSYDFKDVVFARGEYLRQIRKICTMELLSHKRVQSFRSIREDEMSNLVRTISSKAGEVVNLKNLLYASSLSIISRTAFGGKSEHQEAFEKLIPDISEILGGLSIVDLYPSIKLLRRINAMRPKFKGLFRKVDDILESIIQEHRVRKSPANGDEEEVADDLVQVLLDIHDHGDLSISSVKAITLNMFSAGGDTSSTLVEWAMLELLRNPKAMQKAQAEVRSVYAGKREIDEASVHQLKYLNLVIKETLRFHPPVPLLLPRECRESCEVNGFMIPAKTKVIVNAWAIGRDKSHWVEGDEFHPERFSDSSINYRGTDFQYTPFGAGRRMCPGISFGVANVELLLANLLFHFDWQLPSGMKPEELDMTEEFGASVRIKQPLCLVPTIHDYGASE